MAERKDDHLFLIGALMLLGVAWEKSRASSHAGGSGPVLTPIVTAPQASINTTAAIEDAAKNQVNTVVTYAGQNSADVSGDIAAGTSSAAAGVQAAANHVQNTITALQSNSNPVVSAATLPVASALSGTVGVANTAFGTLSSLVGGAAQEASAGISDINSGNTVSGIEDIGKAGVNGIVSAVQSAASGISKTIENVGSDVTSTVSNIVSGGGGGGTVARVLFPGLSL